ncbi:MAG TPA: PD-(D/E)XK nuclease family protein [Novimethylophilus sp.]|jgi:exodeoxyribonuclease-5|uniref:PD-(D/E)XK nuclease family protein n=1 Tax=Novimethylophilus sp. TaxID=2137426 RepID=UPI002F426177
MGDSTVVLCSTHRLARSLCLAHGKTQIAQGLSQWQPLRALTVAQWLDGVFNQAWLTGEVEADRAPRMLLGAMQERILWERAIEAGLQNEPAAALFDRAGMADAAMEASRLLTEWNVLLAPGEQTEETRQFLHWRSTFKTLCRKSAALDATSLTEIQVECLQRYSGLLPAVIFLAGFDRISPQEQRLFDVLEARGIRMERWPLSLDAAADAVQAAYDDVEAECRAAAAWAKACLAGNPQARIAIVAPELGALRCRLSAILDDVLHPETIHPGEAEAPRCYDFSLGAPLASIPLVSTALALLRLATQRYRLPQHDVTSLLGDVYWSAGESEADARARLDARMRRKLGATLSLEQLLRLANTMEGLPRLAQHLAALIAAAAAWPKRETPSAWAAAFVQLLKNTGWPGARGLSSHEFQARQAWTEALLEFSGLDAVLGPVAAAEALQRLARLTRERIFQPEAASEPRLQVMGMLEAQGAPLTAVWVMGMNDHVWPPPARPNPLLPAEAQRRANAPNSCSRVQAEFAAAIQQRLLHSAPQVVFSWVCRDGERELRPSPLLAGMAVIKEAPLPAATLAERLAQKMELQWLDDHLAPPVAEGEKVRGGAGLLRAQAICPAWAYYQYRLGARALEEPVEGLDSMDRGTLLHAVLQCFWNGRGSADLLAMDETALQHAATQAVEQGVRQFSLALDKPLPEHFLALEKQRLQFLLTAWLEFERGRSPFTVRECERRVSLTIEGIAVDLTLDRVDALEDGRLVVLDYKTGSVVSHKSWAETRITEPQLPIYTALALSEGEIAAVCFAKVRADEQRFIGIAHLPDTLPGVDGLEQARKLFDEVSFPDWPSVLAHWKTSIAAIANEIRAGEAAVSFAKEDDLAYCEVKPLLRLPERKLQFERKSGGNDHA